MTTSTLYRTGSLSVPCAATILALIAVGCDSSPETEVSSSSGQPSALLPPEIAEPPAPTVASAAPSGSATEPEARPPWTGPFLGVTRSSAGIYSEPTFERSKKIGYAQEGARIPVHPEKTQGGSCSEGWMRLVDGGYVCGNHGTTNLEDPRIKFSPRQPDLEEILPYRYARNIKNGTPLYKSVPSVEQTRLYEPYRFTDEPSAKEETKTQPAVAKEVDEATRRAQDEQQRRMEALRAARRAMLGEAADDKPKSTEPAPTPQAKPEDAGSEEKHWWQQEDPELHKLKLDDLAKDGDDILSSRLVKGFYISVDKMFKWNDRNWFKSTKGFVAPADRFHFAAGSEFRGVELGEEYQLPVGFVYGHKDSRSTYTFGEDGKTLKTAGTIKRFAIVALTGEEREVNGKTYAEAKDGTWLRRSELRVTNPGPPPEEAAPGETWLDINLSEQTVVAFRGNEPFYATLMSSGKTDKNPEKDHSTPVGAWRIREKHITSTMDGDGTAAGDLPYSIEGVPYVMYFHKAYAVHGAFWHQNYGVKMSHGCVNLAPLDAKYLFFHTDPPVAEGWHGAWSSDDERPGSLVVVHE